MRSLYHLFLLLALVLNACSAHYKVSLSNMEAFGISSANSEDLVFTLKSHKLHYAAADRIEKNNFFSADGSTTFHRDSVLFETNILIPRGATGRCTGLHTDHCLVDFGEGVLLPFYITDDDNRAPEKIEIEGRIYRLIAGKQEARLFFDSRILNK